MIYVPEQVKLNSMLVPSMKLAGPNATYSPDMVGTKVDFSKPVDVTVTDHGREAVWTIYVQTTESTVTV